jgi:hypothetical protein
MRGEGADTLLSSQELVTDGLMSVAAVE